MMDPSGLYGQCKVGVGGRRLFLGGLLCLERLLLHCHFLIDKSARMNWSNSTLLASQRGQKIEVFFKVYRGGFAILLGGS